MAQQSVQQTLYICILPALMQSQGRGLHGGTPPGTFLQENLPWELVWWQLLDFLYLHVSRPYFAWAPLSQHLSMAGPLEPGPFCLTGIPPTGSVCLCISHWPGRHVLRTALWSEAPRQASFLPSLLSRVSDLHHGLTALPALSRRPLLYPPVSLLYISCILGTCLQFISRGRGGTEKWLN